MQKPELFSTPKEFIGVSLALLVILFVHLAFKYTAYQDFIQKPFYYTYANILTAYEKTKKNKTYQVLKLHADNGYIFYTTTHKKQNLSHQRLRLQLFPNNSIGFFDYLGTFYVKSKIKNQEALNLTVKDKLLTWVDNQHKDSSLQSFYNAIFFATPLERNLRDKVSLLGVSHLVALSGFHLGILWALMYGLLMLLYKPLQQKFFPYRFALFDVGVVVIMALGVYVWFVDFPASLVRAYSMVLVGWILLLMGIELLSFRFLSTVALLLLVLFPSLVVSLGFWLSVAGVFYIFLLLAYTQSFNKWMITLLAIPFGIFILMLPIVHGVFGMTSSYQLLSPLLSILFTPFYPLSMVLHLFGVGSILDSALLVLFSLPENGTEHILNGWVVFGYVILSLMAIGSHRVFYGLLGMAVVYSGYLFLL